jgi:excisionase family DNA binding protein
MYNPKLSRNPYFILSRYIGEDIDENLIKEFVFRYIDSELKNGNKNYSVVAGELKSFFIDLTDCILTASVHFAEQFPDKTRNLFTDVLIETVVEVDPTVDELMTVKEISQKLKVTTQQVRNLINTGKIPSIRFGERSIRVRKADFDNFSRTR